MENNSVDLKQIINMANIDEYKDIVPENVLQDMKQKLEEAEKKKINEKIMEPIEVRQPNDESKTQQTSREELLRRLRSKTKGMSQNRMNRDIQMKNQIQSLQNSPGMQQNNKEIDIKNIMMQSVAGMLKNSKQKKKVDQRIQKAMDKMEKDE